VGDGVGPCALLEGRGLPGALPWADGIPTFGLPPDQLAEADRAARQMMADGRRESGPWVRWAYESGFVRPEDDERAEDADDPCASSGGQPLGERGTTTFVGPAHYRRMFDAPDWPLVAAALCPSDRSKALMAGCRVVEEQLMGSDPEAARELARAIAAVLGVAVAELPGPVPVFVTDLPSGHHGPQRMGLAELMDRLHTLAVQLAWTPPDDPSGRSCKPC
jgi:hypothetical protein